MKPETAPRLIMWWGFVVASSGIEERPAIFETAVEYGRRFGLDWPEGAATATDDADILATDMGGDTLDKGASVLGIAPASSLGPSENEREWQRHDDVARRRSRGI